MPTPVPTPGSDRVPGPPVSISAVGPSLSADQGRRTRTYLIQMGVRVGCFVGAVAARGSWLTWVLVAAAIVLPYTAVLFANAGPGRAHYDSSPMDHRRVDHHLIEHHTDDRQPPAPSPARDEEGADEPGRIP